MGAAFSNHSVGNHVNLVRMRIVLSLCAIVIQRLHCQLFRLAAECRCRLVQPHQAVLDAD
jgi:hypothetical protein